jgi:hypothetical protein
MQIWILIPWLKVVRLSPGGGEQMEVGKRSTEYAMINNVSLSAL